MLIFNIDDEINQSNLNIKDIVKFAETQAVTENAAKEYFLTLLLNDENVLSRICEENITAGSCLKEIALYDIKQLIDIINSQDSIKGYIPSVKRKLDYKEYQQSIEAIVSEDEPEKILDKLISHYAVFGGGKLSQYTAFRWADNGLHGIKEPDDISLNRLFCLETQKQELIQNTESFLKGLTANNVLLYGNSGCGKSSAVKALLNEYYKDGLRLIEVPKDSLSELPLIIDAVKNRSKKLRYIIFLDDLSFESDDSGYKKLKSILDGRIEKQPQNILFYATSNRFHLINENWAERKGEDIHINDTKNEKLSLSERFGIRISFSSPDQDEYLKIVEGILSQKNINLTEDIRAEALRWALYYNGRSGRTAAQFANNIYNQNNINTEV